MPLRPATAHFFLPLVADIAKNVQRRVLKQLSAHPPPSAPALANCRLKKLWEIEEVRDLLDPPRMVTAALYDRDVLGGILSAAYSGAPAPLFGRILTLEMLCRAIGS